MKFDILLWVVCILCRYTLEDFAVVALFFLAPVPRFILVTGAYI